MTNSPRRSLIVLQCLLYSLLSLSVSPAREEVSNYETSWIGNSYARQGERDRHEPGEDRWVLQDVNDIFVTEDGTLYTNIPWEEGGGNVQQYQDGELTRIAFHTHGWGRGGGSAVAANEKYVYIAATGGNEGGGLQGNSWPPEGRKWGGISRRKRSDISEPAPFPGGHGDSDEGGVLDDCYKVVNEIPVDASGHEVKGLYATHEHLYVSNPYRDRIGVYDAGSMEKIRHWSLKNPGKLSMDGTGNLWVLRKTDETVRTVPGIPPEPGQGRSYKKRIATGYAPDGSKINTIRFGKNVRATDLTFNRKNQLLITDAGPANNVRIYDVDTGNQTDHFGDPGGIYAHDGAFGTRRFNQPMGVGVDGDGNLYVASSGSSAIYSGGGGGSTVLESYTSSGTLNWRRFGLEFVDHAGLDPGNRRHVYTKEEHFVLDFSKPPGRQWSYEGFTVDPYQFPDDPRIHRWSAGGWIRRIRGRRFLFVTGMILRDNPMLQVFRFNESKHGETAIPSVVFSYNHIDSDTGWPPNQPGSGEWIWRDQNGDGSFDDGEYDARGEDIPSRIRGLHVDNNGTVWQPTQSDGIRVFPLQEIDENGNLVWTYESVKTFNTPDRPAFEQVRRIRYNPETDVLYLGGTTSEHKNQHWKPMGPVITRYDRWSEGNRKPTWSKVLKYSKKTGGHLSSEPMGFDIAGRYVFVSYTAPVDERGFEEIDWSHVKIYDKRTGRNVGYMNPSEKVGKTGLQDIVLNVRAYRRNSGEYLVFIEDDAFAKVLMYRWKPT